MVTQTWTWLPAHVFDVFVVQAVTALVTPPTAATLGQPGITFVLVARQQADASQSLVLPQSSGFPPPVTQVPMASHMTCVA